MRKFTLSLVVLFCFGLYVFAEAPANYYSSANGKSGNSLRLALQDIIDNHTVVGYDNLNYLYVASDSHDDGSLWDMYSTCSWKHQTDKCGNYKNVCDCYNKEHSVPQSWFNSKSPMQSDAFHVVPTDGKVNGQRSNYPFGECSGGKVLDSKALGRLGSSTFSGYSGTVFEPDDEYKGDFARGYFYMATRYADKCSNWGNQMFGSVNGLTTYSVNLLLKWHREDPVSEKERVRNDAIFGINNSTGYKQGNRNPFIDYPCLAEYIWGDKKNETVDFSKLLSAYDKEYISGDDKSGCNCTPTKPTIIYPTDGVTVNVGSANVNSTISTDINIQGLLLTKALTLTLSGTNASMFELSANQISASEGLEGVDIIVSYTPTAIGEHKATLTISSSELTKSVVVNLIGSSTTTLVSPSNSSITFYCEDVRQPETGNILIKATNTTSDISLSISGTNKSLFSINKTTITAANAQEGEEIAVTYSPTTIGRHTATLVISSADFTTRNITLDGTTTFTIFDASDITNNSFTATWSDAGVNSYTLNVYTKEISESSEQEIINLTSLTSDIIDANKDILSLSGKTYYESDALRLGTSKGDGTLTVIGDFSKGGTIAITAKAYNNDASVLKITSGSNTIAEETLTTNFKAYTYTITPNDLGKIVISQGASGERVIISQLAVTGGAKEVIENKSAIGYPKNVGNVTSYIVTELDCSKTYYYTVTPAGNAISEELSVELLKTTVDDMAIYQSNNDIIYYINDNMVVLTNLFPSKSLTIYNAMGQSILTIDQVQQTETLTLPQGIYIVQHNNKTIKLIVEN